MIKKIITIVLAVFAFILNGSPLNARLPGELKDISLFKTLMTYDLDNDTRFDVNNINMFVTNHGSFAWDIATGNSGLYFPKGTEKTAVFASGLWIGCEVDGEVRVVVAEFSQEFAPGNMADGTFIPDNRSFRVYKINKGDGAENPDWVNWPVDQGAPVDSHGSPLVLGDQTLWCVYNDADPSYHSNSAGNSDPLGIEIQQTTFGFNRQGALGNTVFLKFLILNKGNNVLENTFVSLWSDPDLGGASDDLVGCDIDISLGYCYNSTNNDELYLDLPPAVGYDFFQGPRGDDGKILPMTSFNKYINGTDPTNRYESYNYMRGLKSNGSFLIDPTTGRITRFAVSGNPVTGEGWLDADPADRRFMLSAGPFTFAPNDTQEVVAAIIIGQGTDRLSSITALKFFDTFAQDAFDSGFALPEPPPQPTVETSALDKKVVLAWDAEAESYNSSGYRFEGYNLYQGESVAGPWKRIATYDLKNGVKIIFDEEFDLETGVILNKPVQYGSDKGIRQYIEITEDFIGGGRLINAKPYYYTVTAYGYNENNRPKSLETAISPIGVIPQTPVLGTVPDTASADLVPVYSRMDTKKAPATDSVAVKIVDPLKVTGHQYQVFYQFENPPVVMNDQMIPYTWGLRDLTTGMSILSHQKNKKDDEHYPVVDGIQVKVIGGYDQGLSDVRYIDRPEGTSQGLLPFDWGGQFFEGGADFGSNFFGSRISPEKDGEFFSPAEIRFSYLSQQRAYRYLRVASGSSVAYRYADFVKVPFTVVDPVTNRPLNVAFTEDFGSPSHNGSWGPAVSEDGGREVIIIFSSTYTDTPDPLYVARNILTDAEELDVMYVIWLRRQTGSLGIEPGDKIVFTWHNPGDTNDFYTFSTTSAIVNDKELAKSELHKIRVVPNPYFGHSSYELSQFHRRIKFTHLPEKCIIRIFTLAGSLIKTLYKDDPNTSILEWDVLTENRLTPASGIYLYHIEADGIGETYGKIAIFTEQERLSTF